MNDESSLDELDLALAATVTWGAQLANVLAAPDDLATRTAEKVRVALLTRSVVAAGTDLIGVGWHTLRLLLSDDPRTGQDRT